MQKKGYLICFIGIDGSGKSTLAMEEYPYLQNNGKEKTYVYGRVRPIISKIMMDVGRFFFLKRQKQDIFFDYDNYTLEKKKVIKNNGLKFLLEFAFLFDQIIQVYVKILPLLLKKKIVFSDRYIYDTIVTDLSSDFGYTDSKIFKLIHLTLKLVPKPDIVFYIDVSPEVAFSRKDDVPHINYLIQRKKLYDLISVLPNFEKIDGAKSIADVKKEINTKLESLVE